MATDLENASALVKGSLKPFRNKISKWSQQRRKQSLDDLVDLAKKDPEVGKVMVSSLGSMVHRRLPPVSQMERFKPSTMKKILHVLGMPLGLVKNVLLKAGRGTLTLVYYLLVLGILSYLIVAFVSATVLTVNVMTEIDQPLSLSQKVSVVSRLFVGSLLSMISAPGVYLYHKWTGKPLMPDVSVFSDL